MTPDRFFLLYALDPVDAWRADLMVWDPGAPKCSAFLATQWVEDASRETLLERLSQSYPGVRNPRARRKRRGEHVTGAEVILLWEQKPPRAGWSAAFLRETSDGTLTEVFTVTRNDRTRLEESLRELWPGVKVIALDEGIPT